MSSDLAEKLFSPLLEDINSNEKGIVSEEDTKIQIILRIFTEALGWSHTDISAERKHANGFSDFILSASGKEAFLVEAKRIGLLSMPTVDTDKVRTLKLSGSTMKDIQEGIEQAAGYAAPEGIQIAVLTDGKIWVVFKSFISGQNYKFQTAFVFPSLKAIANDFTLFYELLSKDSYRKKLYSAHFDRLQNDRLLVMQALKSPIVEQEIKIQAKTDIAFDLDQIFTAFFSRLTGDKDEELLIDCFVETRESRIADFALEKMAANVLGNLIPNNKEVDAELSALIEQSVEVETGQTVFIVGPTGSGKSTFLDRFFKKTLSSALRRQCVIISIDCLDASGSKDSTLHWLTETLIKNLEKKLYEDGIPSWDQLKGLYFTEYERRKKGVDAPLYETDQKAFQKKFGEYLDEKVERNREEYLRRILSDVVCNRGKLPIITIDNTDEFLPEFKLEVFQFFQSLRREINHCLLIFPLTDKSAWSFSKTDMYSIYKSKSFFLPTPPPREVFRKRIDFIRNKMKSFSSERDKKEYMATKGIRISIQNIEGFASLIEDVFVEQEYTAKVIGELANYNIRKTLELSQRVITSSMYRVEDLLSAAISGKIENINYPKFMNALLKGDYEVYRQSDRHFVSPIFQASDHIRQSPLLQIRILALLVATKNAARTIEDKHISMQSLLDYFDSMDCPESALSLALSQLMESGLVEPFDTSVRDIGPDQKVAITHSGIRHYTLAMYDGVFFEQMALTTAITDHSVAEKIRSQYLSDKTYKDRMKEIRSLFHAYIVSEDLACLTIPENGDQFEIQRQLVPIMRRSDQPQIETSKPSLGSVAWTDFNMDSVIGIIERYDPEKNIGYLEIEGIEGPIFMPSDASKRDLGVSRLFVGDSVLCDVGRNQKGFYVKRLHDFETAKNVEAVEGTVIRIFDDRRYGFLRIGEGKRTAFFHFLNMRAETLKCLAVGNRVAVEVIPDKKAGEYYVRYEIEPQLTGSL